MQKQEQPEPSALDMMRVAFLGDANNSGLRPPLPSSSYFLGAASFQDINRTSYEPTQTDVLLGRGVATNRHPGNENFRHIVSQHIDDYVTSTKKQKMMISRSIVHHVRTQLNPPGKFLEKNALTGLWHKVEDKRAFEKTAQALRDGAAPLRKQLTKDMEEPAFLESVFDDNGASPTNKSLDQSEDRSVKDKGTGSANESLGKLVPKKSKKHRRTKTAPITVGDIFPSDNTANKPGPRPKKLRSNPDIAGSSVEPTEMDRVFVSDMLAHHQLSQQPQTQAAPFYSTDMERLVMAEMHTRPQRPLLSSNQQFRSVSHQQHAAPSTSMLPLAGTPRGNINHIVNMPQHQRNPSLTNDFINALQLSDASDVSFPDPSTFSTMQQEQPQSRRGNNEGQSFTDTTHAGGGGLFPTVLPLAMHSQGEYHAYDTPHHGPHSSLTDAVIVQHQTPQSRRVSNEGQSNVRSTTLVTAEGMSNSFGLSQGDYAHRSLKPLQKDFSAAALDCMSKTLGPIGLPHAPQMTLSNSDFQATGTRTEAGPNSRTSMSGRPKLPMADRVESMASNVAAAGTSAMQSQGNYHAYDTSHHGLRSSLTDDGMVQYQSRQVSNEGQNNARSTTCVTSEGIKNSFEVSQVDYAHRPLNPMQKEPSVATLDCMLKALEPLALPHAPQMTLSNSDYQTTGTPTVVGSSSICMPMSNRGATGADALVNSENGFDEEEFAREMGSDEHFFGLSNSDGTIDEFDTDAILHRGQGS